METKESQVPIQVEFGMVTSISTRVLPVPCLRQRLAEAEVLSIVQDEDFFQAAFSLTPLT
jgi:hypothetical protein